MLGISNCAVGVKHNGVTVSVQSWESHKRPVLAIQLEGENRIYKVASFNSAETANWFVEIMEEFFEGLVNRP